MNLFIGCSSSNNIDNKYMDDCNVYLSELLKENDLVFGAYKEGLMGLSYEIAKCNNREIIGVTPKVFERDLVNLDCDKKIITEDILGRTGMLIKNCDALIFLPGGIGTILELVAAIDMKRNGEFDKPIIIYNSYNFFGELFIFLNKIYVEKFSSINVSECYYFASDANDTLSYIKNYKKNI